MAVGSAFVSAVLKTPNKLGPLHRMTSDVRCGVACLWLFPRILIGLAERLNSFLDGADVAVGIVGLPSHDRPQSSIGLCLAARAVPEAALGLSGCFARLRSSGPYARVLLPPLRGAWHRRTSHARGPRRLPALSAIRLFSVPAAWLPSCTNEHCQ